MENCNIMWNYILEATKADERFNGLNLDCSYQKTNEKRAAKRRKKDLEIFPREFNKGFVLVEMYLKRGEKLNEESWKINWKNRRHFQIEKKKY